MQKLILATLVALAATGAAAQGSAVKPKAAVLCNTCGTVQDVHQEKRKGKGGVAGIAGGAVVGGLLGNQVGGGTGKTVATVGGAVVGGVVGNEVQKQVTSKKVWVTRVRMKDGSIRNFEQEAQPAWGAGTVVRADGATLVRP